MMKDSTIGEAWIREQMAKNPPSLRPNGDIFSGPVRLSFPNIFEPGKPSEEALRANPDAKGKFGASILFPPGTDMTLFKAAWHKCAKEKFPEFWNGDQPVNLHLPFHDQSEKAFGVKPLAGYTPGAMMFACTSNYKPTIVDARLQMITDTARVYPGVWAFVVMNVYDYGRKAKGPSKKGVGFGMQQLMIIADDTKFGGGGGGGDPKQAFAGVTITAQANVAAKFDAAPQPGAAPAAAGIMPAGGHVGQVGHLPVHPLPGAETEDERLMREMMGG